MSSGHVRSYYILPADRLDDLIKTLKGDGYEVIGPKLRDLALNYEEIDNASELPRGIIDETRPGYYRLKSVDEPLYFGVTHTQCNWKRLLYPVEMIAFKAKRVNGSFEVKPVETPLKRRAFLGVRPCDLSAIKILDKVLLGGPFIDDVYKQNRENTFIIAVNCTRSVDTCFCASLGTGPKADSGYDLALTEIYDERGHRFVVTHDSERGAEIIKRLKLAPASEEEVAKAEEFHRRAAEMQTRKVHTGNVKEVLYANLESPRWDELDKRCLGCGNCTMVCPTCFCTTMYDYTSFTGDEAWRVRLYDSCFTVDYAYIHGGSLRKDRRFTYRHWLTHKYATWQDQFGVIGCVGCGRCITWCPVGIAINDEVNAFTTVNV